MKIYKPLVELARTTRCHFATKSVDGWIPCRSNKNATHLFVYAIEIEPSYRRKRSPSKGCD